MTRGFVEDVREWERDRDLKYDARDDWFRIGNFAIALHRSLEALPWLKPINGSEFRSIVARGIDGMPKGYAYRVYVRYNDDREIKGVTFWRSGSATTPGNQYEFLREIEA